MKPPSVLKVKVKHVTTWMQCSDEVQYESRF